MVFRKSNKEPDIIKRVEDMLDDSEAQVLLEQKIQVGVIRSDKKFEYKHMKALSSGKRGLLVLRGNSPEETKTYIEINLDEGKNMADELAQEISDSKEWISGFQRQLERLKRNAGINSAISTIENEIKEVSGYLGIMNEMMDTGMPCSWQDLGALLSDSQKTAHYFGWLMDGTKDISGKVRARIIDLFPKQNGDVSFRVHNGSKTVPGYISSKKDGYEALLRIFRDTFPGWLPDKQTF